MQVSQVGMSQSSSDGSINTTACPHNVTLSCSGLGFVSGAKACRAPSTGFHHTTGPCQDRPSSKNVVTTTTPSRSLRPMKARPACPVRHLAERAAKRSVNRTTSSHHVN